MTENLFMILIATVIGVLAGFGAVGIRSLIREISAICFPGDATILDNIVAAPWYYKLLIPTLGGLIVGPIIYRWAHEAKGTGVPEVMQSVLVKGGKIRPRVAFLKTLVSTITIGTGGSVGREGPIVQIGASLGSVVGQFFHIPAKRMKTLVGCGAAAGIAAAFNAPVAGALFALEIILMDYAVSAVSLIVISSVMATVVSHAFEGDFPVMEIMGTHYLHSFWEIFLYIGLGLLCGIVSFLFIRSVFSIGKVWEEKFNIKPWLKAAVGGACIGLIALLFPQIMGVGYESINLALNHESMTYMGVASDTINQLLGNQVFWVMVLVLVAVKVFATSMTLGSGGSGGIFAPSLFIGAMLGGFFGHFAHLWFPDVTASPGTYALMGMGGIVAGATRAPITAIVTIFELTKQQTSIFPPLMITCIIATLVSSKFSRESIYTLKLLMRNISIRGHAEHNVMKSLHVRDVYCDEFVTVPENADFKQIVDSLMSSGAPYISVHYAKSGAFMGTVSISTIKDVMFQQETLRYVCIAGDIADKKVRQVFLDDNCHVVLRKMRQSGCDSLPVFDIGNEKKQIGVVNLQDIVAAYEHEIDHIDLTSGLADRIVMANLEDDIRFLEGYVVTEVHAPRSWHGKTIMELGVRHNYGVDILSIKHAGGGTKVDAIPHANHKISRTDLLVVAGKTDKINVLRNLH